MNIIFSKSNNTFTSVKSWLKKEQKETAILLRCIPSAVVTLFVVSVICMNLLANKTLIQTHWIALDGGILVSWLSFMCMDIITKYFGPKASNKIAILASAINILTCLIFYIASIIPSNANDYTALNEILGGTWFILLGSTIAFLMSSVINNFLNWTIGKAFHKNPNGKLAYATQTYISTFVGQFLDNLIFSIIVFVGFAPIFWDGFHWTILQCTICALTGAIAELIMEIVFSPFGYRIVTNWKTHNIGQEYLTHIKGGKQKCEY
ncbi:MAG: VUT family protein [Lachnospiraceae bacterium]|nr:VUT family protein [Lachnospiraceae bacterium]